ncbi:MAG: alpha-glucuronidase family glycosyl hydrolase [Balneolales bacterium]
MQFLINHFFILVFGLTVSFGNTKTDKVEPVGYWNFIEKSAYDISGQYYANIKDDSYYDMGNGHYAIRVNEDEVAMRIPVEDESPLAIDKGTVSFWMNYAWDGRQIDVVSYDNSSIEIQFYRRHLMPRFRGDGFRFGSNMIDDDWSNQILREFAFYPHDKAVANEGEWHFFVVTYDYENEQIIGYRDGEKIHIVDLSHLDESIAMESLKRRHERNSLEEIIVGDGFSGFIGEVGIYDKVLSQRQVTNLYNETKQLYEGRTDHIAERQSELYEYAEKDSTLYNAWLQYKRVTDIHEGNESVMNQLVIDSSNPTIVTAGRELSNAVNRIWGKNVTITKESSGSSNVILGTPETSDVIRTAIDGGKIDLTEVEYDGYIIKTVNIDGNSNIIIAANKPGGVIHGTFHLIRKISLNEDLTNLSIINSPHVGVRIVNHWDMFRGHTGDKWLDISISEYNSEGSRYHSIFSWEDLRTGETKRIEDWARLLASAGWNAIAPSEINWESRNNFMNHLDEVEVLADILRNYGIQLFWSPSYLHALNESTAKSLYARVPDFGGYLLKLGSEAQFGDPRPAMVNDIADNLKPYGGLALVRTFVYGRGRYYNEIERVDNFRRWSLYRNTIPYAIFEPEDGNYRDNVVIVNKASPLDWDLSAPDVTPLDGVITDQMYSPEMMISKQYILSWVEKWKKWFVEDNFRDGPGSQNKNYIDMVLGISMISPTASWTSNPINMVNYYGLGRLTWDPDANVDDIYEEWASLTFGDKNSIVETMNEILYLSEDVIRNLYVYRGYRGVWLDRGSDVLAQNKTPHWVNEEGIGIFGSKEQKQVINQFSSVLQSKFMDKKQAEGYLPFFHFVPWDYELSNGMTVIEDFYYGLDTSLKGAHRLLELWDELEGYIDERRFEYTRNHMELNINYVSKWRDRYIKAVEQVTGLEYSNNRL